MRSERVRFGHLDADESCRGQGLSWAWFDEAAPRWPEDPSAPTIGIDWGSQPSFETLRGPKLADLRDAIAKFNAVGLSPWIGSRADYECDPVDIVADVNNAGAFTTVWITGAGWSRIRAARAR